jgi:DNA-binding beta-propeller fold protein YncE
VYVAEVEIRVQYFTLDGAYLGSWTAPDSIGGFLDSRTIATDIAGNVYVADGVRILKFTADGEYLLRWGSYGTGPGQFSQTMGIVTDVLGRVYVADQSGSARIQMFSSEGAFLLSWSATERPAYVAADENANIYVTDVNLNLVSKYSSTGTLLAQWGSTGTGNGQFSCPTGVAVDLQQNVFVADQTCTDTYARIQKFSNAIVPIHAESWGAIKARYR